jgi:hypothetical protein
VRRIAVTRLIAARMHEGHLDLRSHVASREIAPVDRWFFTSKHPSHPNILVPIAWLVALSDPQFGSLAVNKCEHFVCCKSMNTNNVKPDGATMR